MTVVYLHIGTHKTGSTSIQKFLTLNSEKLLAKNFLYPLSGRISNAQHNLALSIRRNKNKTSNSLANDWYALHEEISSHQPEYVVLSSEEFEFAYADRLHRANLVKQVESYLSQYTDFCSIYR
jgi:hypothetical protein